MSILEITIFAYTSIFILGLIFGSYLNSWMWRIHEGTYVFGGRSVCVHCRRQLAWYENIPLFSYIFLKGKCRTCKAPIPWNYLAVEFFTALLFVFLINFHVSNSFSEARVLRDAFFVSILIIIFAYDALYGIILSGIILIGSVVGFLLNYFYLGMTPVSLLVGLLVGGGFFLVQYLISKGKWIGGGDVRFGAMMGVWLGWPQIILALFLSYILGALVAIPLLILKKKNMGSEIPFGTFLAIGTFISIFWGNQILNWYLGLLK